MVKNLEIEMHDGLMPFSLPRYFRGIRSGRRASFGGTAGAAAALGALAGCGGGGGGGGGEGGGTTIPGGSHTGTSDADTIDLVDRGGALMSVDAGAGNDTINTGAGEQTIDGGVGDDTIDGGAGDDTIDGGEGVDTAVFAGAAAGYHVTAELEGTNVSFTVEDNDADADGDDGTDTLESIEVLRFGGNSLAVVGHGAADRTAEDAEVVLGDATPNGAGTELFDGGGGDDLMFGFGGDDVMVGGAGDDRMFGGDGDDTLTGGADYDTLTGGVGDDTIDGGAGDGDVAVYSGARADYLVSMIDGEGGGPARFLVIHETDTNSDGRDTLTNVEMIRFGAAAPVALNAELATDGAPLGVASGAPTASEEYGAGAPIAAIDVSMFFEVADGVDATYGIDGTLPAGLVFSESTGMLTGTAPTASTTITIIASHVDGATYDDVAHEYVITVAAAGMPTNVLDATDNIHVDPNMAGMENATIEGLAGDDAITGGAGDDTLFGNSATVLGTDGERDTAVYGGVLAGYSISAELHTFNPDGGGAVENVPRITVTDTATTGAGAVDEGTDTLVGFEVVRFQNAAGGNLDLMVVRAGAATGANAEILLGTEGPDGSSTGVVDGGAGDDFIFGFAMDDHLSGGAGDDRLDGGAGSDTAVFGSAMEGYRVSAALSGGVVEFEVNDTDTADDDDAGTVDDEGRDTLINFESIRFGADTLSVVDDPADSRGTADGAEIIVGDDTGNGTMDAVVGGGGGGDLMFGFGGDDFLSGGAGDDVIHGGMGDDTAVFAAAIAGYGVSAALSGDVLELTVRDTDTTDDRNDATVDDEGVDTLIGIETIRFGTADVAVVGHDTDAGERTGANAEIIVGDATGNGDAAARVDGGGGDDLIFGFGGDDHIEGGAGDDHIDGGVGMDTAYFTGVRTDYRVWQAMEGMEPTAVTRIMVKYKHNSDDAGDDFGLDTLMNVETLVFGSEPAITLDGYAGYENGLPRVTSDAPETLTVEAGTEEIDVSRWFDATTGVTYSASASTGAVTVSGGTVTLATPIEGAPVTITLTVTASVDTPASGGAEVIDYDDVSHEVVITASPAFDDTGNTVADTDLPGMEGRSIEGLAGDDVITGRAGDDMLFGNSSEVLQAATGTDSDTAVFLGELDDYTISVALHTFNAGGAAPTPEVENVPMITVHDDEGTSPAAPSTPDEGRDELVGFEVVRFQSGTGSARGDDVDLMVVRNDTAGRTLTDDVDEIVIGRAVADGTDAPTGLMGGAGDDFMFGLGGDDFLTGGAGDDTITGGAGDDVLDGGANDDTAVFEGGLAGYNISAALTGGDVTLTVEDSATGVGMVDDGGDTLIGFEVVRFANGTIDDGGDDVDLMVVRDDTAGRTLTDDVDEIVVGQAAADGTTLATGLMGGAGDDQLFGLGGGDFISGGAGDDVITGGLGGDTIDGGDNNDIAVFAGARDGYMITGIVSGSVYTSHMVMDSATGDGGEGTDTLTNIETLRFLNGDDAHEDVLVAMLRLNVITGGATADTILGGSGDQTINAGAEDDTITGGEGDDTIDGEAGDEDTAVFLGNLVGFRITATLVGTDATFMVEDVATTEPGESDEGEDTLSNIENLMFGGSTFAVVAHGSATAANSEIILGDDEVQGDSATMLFDGGAGVDVIFGFGGDDFLGGGAGDDMISGGAGSDIIDGGADDDTAVFEGALSGYGVSAAYSGTVIQITVEDTATTGTGAVDEGTDTLINIERLLFDGTALSLVRHDTTGRTLADAVGEIVIGQDAAADGTDAATGLMGGAGDDHMFGFGGDDFLTGGVGDDIVDGGAGDGDTAVFAGSIAGFHIAATLSGSNATFEVKDFATTGGGEIDEGTDTVRNIENLMFGGATLAVVAHGSATAANSEIILGDDGGQGTSASSLFDAGAEVDVVFGFGGDDFIGGGSGDDVISGGAGNDHIDGGADNDTAVFEGGLSGYGISAALSGADVEITVEDTATTGAGAVDEGTDTLINIERFRFDGATLSLVLHDTTGRTLTDAVGEIVVGQDAVADGTDAATGLMGGAGDDFIFGFGGDDFLTGGLGDDVIDGGAGDGDTAVFAGSLAGFHITATLSGSDATFRIKDIATTGGGEIDEGADTVRYIENLMFGGATFAVVAHDAITPANSEIILGNDNQQGSSASTRFSGGGEVDVIFGFGGGDFIDGGMGDDMISGGAGDDNIDGGAGNDIALFEGDMTGYGISAAWSGTDFELTVEYTATSGGGADNEGTDTLINIERLQFDGNTLYVVMHDTVGRTLTDSVDEIVIGQDAVADGMNAATALMGGVGDDQLFGFGGNDFLDGGAGHDSAVYDGNRDGYNVSIQRVEVGGEIVVQFRVIDLNPDNGDEGTDILTNIEEIQFSDHAVLMSDAGTGSDDILIDSDYAGLIDGGAGHDVIAGLGGDDTLEGGAGSDTLEGGAGNDVLYGNTRVDASDDQNIDTAVFAGIIEDYLFDRNTVSGAIIVMDSSDGGEDGINEGRDSLLGIDRIVFGDGKVLNTQNIHIGSDQLSVRNAELGLSVNHGGGGVDQFTSTDGADIFQYREALDSPPGFESGGRILAGNDSIFEFNAAEGDRIALADIPELKDLSVRQTGSSEQSGVSTYLENSMFRLQLGGFHTLSEGNDYYYVDVGANGMAPTGTNSRQQVAPFYDAEPESVKLFPERPDIPENSGNGRNADTLRIKSGEEKGMITDFSVGDDIDSAELSRLPPQEGWEEEKFATGVSMMAPTPEVSTVNAREETDYVISAAFA